MAFGRVLCSFTKRDSIAEDNLFTISSKNRIGFDIKKSMHFVYEEFDRKQTFLNP
jgi:hypothetical protein